MKFPFLENNELILIDYVPGSSGQLLARLWSELDSKVDYDNPKILANAPITAHPASTEINYDILIPKRIMNWFLEKCEPSSTLDYAHFFENLGINLVAQRQKWNSSSKIKFYEAREVEIKGMRVLYPVHTWSYNIPYKALNELGYNVRCVPIIPKTDRGLRYQYNRNAVCCPGVENWIDRHITEFNSKSTQTSIDLCTLLVDKNSDEILNWLRSQIGDSFRNDKVDFCKTMLAIYFKEIVDNVQSYGVAKYDNLVAYSK